MDQRLARKRRGDRAETSSDQAERRPEPASAQQLARTLGTMVDGAAVELATGGMQWRIPYPELLARQRLKVEGPLAASVSVIAVGSADRSAAST